MIFTTGLLVGLLVVTSVGATLLPETRMDFSVSIAHKAFYDSSRKDPHNEIADRPMMASLYFPVHKHTCDKLCAVQYMPTETAKVMDGMFFGNENIDVFRKFETRACCSANKALNPNEHNIVVLEPGVGTSRYIYGAVAKEIASQGHAVLVIDHPYDSEIIEMSAGEDDAKDHSVLRPQSPPLSPFHPITSWNSTVEDLVQARIRDINFVLSQMTDLTVVKELFPGFEIANVFDTKEVGVIGHGLGGAVATYMVTSGDPRFHVSVNMGGSPPNITSDTTSTILFFGRSSYRREDDPLWSAAWKHLKGLSTEYDMDDAGFMQYSDLPLIAELGGQTDKNGIPKSNVKGLGPIYGTRSWMCGSYLARVYLTMYLRNQWNSPNGVSRELADLVQFFTEMRPWQPKKSS
ncbi:hypothetical protein B0J11DRAFT_504834 [Dendryphion nanum]|uniref:1-alkyl-2-acetylglycerophosphocholine esterase n=1 Tax=Dendryphion nanum TaxID=256645 RepID=A0A9P9DXN9_9PLEO|nr:hypothetical protein B0J11DRAFT_504834 [Dendryphion nanum]